MSVLARELAVAPAYGARFVNVHIGSHRGRASRPGIARLADGVARALADARRVRRPRCSLENSAGSGDGLGTSVDELARILEVIAARGVAAARVGLCLDTAHLWGAGVGIGAAEDVDALVEVVAARIGLERLAMIHLNDLKVPFGTTATGTSTSPPARSGPRASRGS